MSGSKIRPALIISTDLLNKSGDVVCLQITSKMFDDAFFVRFDSKMLLTPLLLESGIRLQKIFTINDKLIIRKISEIKPDTFIALLSLLNSKVFNG